MIMRRTVSKKPLKKPLVYPYDRHVIILRRMPSGGLYEERDEHWLIHEAPNKQGHVRKDLISSVLTGRRYKFKNCLHPSAAHKRERKGEANWTDPHDFTVSVFKLVDGPPGKEFIAVSEEWIPTKDKKMEIEEETHE